MERVGRWISGQGCLLYRHTSPFSSSIYITSTTFRNQYGGGRKIQWYLSDAFLMPGFSANGEGQTNLRRTWWFRNVDFIWRRLVNEIDICMGWRWFYPPVRVDSAGRANCLKWWIVFCSVDDFERWWRMDAQGMDMNAQHQRWICS